MPAINSALCRPADRLQKNNMYESASRLALRIRAGETSAVEAVDACLDRISRFNPEINAVVTLDLDGARKAATLADLWRTGGSIQPPLLGVPITIKDAFATAGLRTTSSHPPLADYVPREDATVVARMRHAGAVILGKTNLPQLAADLQCRSPLFGTTNNPWHRGFTPGGSSGGSAAAVATGFSYLELGSDLAGSIRVPAAYCGVAGLKATENRIPRTGHIPHLPGSRRSVRHLLSFGLLAREVADLEAGMAIIAGPDGQDLEVPAIPAGTASCQPGKLRIAWWDDFGGLPLCSRTRAALTRAVVVLQQAGHTVERCCPGAFDFSEAWQAYGIIAGCEVGLGMPFAERAPLAAIGRVMPKSQPLTHAFLAGLSAGLRAYNEALNARERLSGILEQFLGKWDIWLCPVAPTTAYPHSPPGLFRRPPTIIVGDVALPYLEGTASMTTPFSLTGNPVVVLPAGIESGLPVGLQWVGRRWQDEALMARCRQVENLLGGFRPPPDYI